MVPPCAPGLWACSFFASEAVFLSATEPAGVLSDLTAEGASFPEPEQPTRTVVLMAARAKRLENRTSLRIMIISFCDQSCGEPTVGALRGIPWWFATLRRSVVKRINSAGCAGK